MSRKQSKPVTVYLLHFNSPFKHARHYIGVTRRDEVEGRLEEHRTGRGANLTKVIRDAGIGFTLARTWENAPFAYERSLKNQGGASRACPICKVNGTASRTVFRAEAA